MVQIKTQDSCFSKTTAPESPPDIRKSAARLRYFHHKDVRQLIAVKKESGFMKRSFIYCIRASADIREVLQGLCGDVGYEGILECSFEVAASISLAPRSDEGKVFKATRPCEAPAFEFAFALSCGFTALHPAAR